jgi:histidine triad (HIT) family protein
MSDCLFCRVARHEVDAVIVHEDDELLAFLDIAPIRPAHTQIIPKVHVATFELLSPALITKIVTLGQQLARRMKERYRVERVAFLFTGGDVAHAHAHVVPLHEQTDITSARYIVAPPQVSWGSGHLRVGVEALRRVRDELAFRIDG